MQPTCNKSEMYSEPRQTSKMLHFGICLGYDYGLCLRL